MNKSTVYNLLDKIDSLQSTIDKIKTSNLPNIVKKCIIWAGKTKQNHHLEEITLLLKDK